MGGSEPINTYGVIDEVQWELWLSAETMVPLRYTRREMTLHNKWRRSGPPLAIDMTTLAYSYRDPVTDEVVSGTINERAIRDWRASTGPSIDHPVHETALNEIAKYFNASARHHNPLAVRLPTTQTVVTGHSERTRQRSDSAMASTAAIIILLGAFGAWRGILLLRHTDTPTETVSSQNI